MGREVLVHIPVCLFQVPGSEQCWAKPLVGGLVDRPVINTILRNRSTYT